MHVDWRETYLSIGSFKTRESSGVSFPKTTTFSNGIEILFLYKISMS